MQESVSAAGVWRKLVQDVNFSQTSPQLVQLLCCMSNAMTTCDCKEELHDYFCSIDTTETPQHMAQTDRTARRACSGKCLCMHICLVVSAND